MVKPDIHKAAAVIIRNRKLLVSRSKGKDYFVSPGGKIEIGESVTDALARELAEEQGITFSMDDLELLGKFNAVAKGHEDAQLSLQMDVYILKEYTGNLTPQAEIVENLWIDSTSAQTIDLGSIFAHDVVPLLKVKDLID